MKSPPRIGQPVQFFDPALTPQPPHFKGTGPYAALITGINPDGYVHVVVFMPWIAPVHYGPIAYGGPAQTDHGCENPATDAPYWIETD